jgi:anticodon-binding protein
MNAAIPIKSDVPRENLFSAADVNEILHEHAWLTEDAAENDARQNWIARAAFLLGPQAADRAALAELLALIFNYDAPSIMQTTVSHAVLIREGAREVIRELALAILEGSTVDSERFKVIITGIKSRVPYTGRELFYPVRLALAGRVGGGELDRVILLLDDAAATLGLAPVKNTRQRMLEFCAAME